MRLLVINPNTTRAMTGSIGDTARRAARPGTEIDAPKHLAGDEPLLESFRPRLGQTGPVAA